MGLLDMATNPPSWLNKEFLRKAIQNERNDPDTIIISSKIEAATAVGENYGSTMYRITVTFKRDGNTEETSLIIKTLPEASEEIQKLMEQSPVFKNETHMYAVIIPEMQNLLNKAKHKNYQPLAAKYIYHSTKPQPVAIVLQDLKREGFKLAEQNLGLDMNHGLLVMRTIARFHACSLVLYRNNPERFETFEDSVYGKEDNAAMTNLLTVNMKAVAEESQGEDKIAVESSEIKMATAPGDNYASYMYRASVQVLKNGEKEKISLIIKAELENKEMAKFVAEGDAFGREINMFELIIPNLSKLLEDAAPGKYPPYGARCLYTYKGSPASFLVFEDLKAERFTLAQHSDGLDLDHCMLAIRTLAAYHAASVVFKKAEPEKCKKFDVSFWDANIRDSIEKIYNRVLKALAIEAENWPECKGHVVNVLKELSVSGFDHLVGSSKRQDDDFNVLCHGDAWVNNMMFVDFQVSFWTSPAIDLLYFINSNSTIEILENQNILIDEYYKILCDTFTTLGHSELSPKKSHIYEQIEKRHKYGVISGIVLLSAIFIDRDSVPDLDDILTADGSLPLSEKFKTHIRPVLSVFHKKGWL
ncbi:hypothetical protein C0J52_09452 [Blattella germanica]|nr:hypothetical protein C0J52_09452 [Blattella germanica]